MTGALIYRGIALLCAAVMAAAGLARETYRLGRVDYTVVGDRDGTAAGLVSLLDAEFTAATAELFDRLNVRRPASFNVIICRSAPVFTRLTGKDWRVAALYDPAGERYYFQNPGSLKRQGLLGMVARHEVCHHALRLAAGKKSGEPWLEESFCESLYPTGSAGAAPGGAMTRHVRTLRELKEFITGGLAGKDPGARARAYSMARGWGAYARERLGEARFMAIVIGTAPDRDCAALVPDFLKGYSR